MARAGFTAISSSAITFGKDGRWYSDGEAIPNRAICRLFSRALQVLPDGRARLELGEDTAWVTLEDTPWVIVHVTGDPAAGFVLELNDDTCEALDPETLRVGGDNVLYCRVKHGTHPARFLRPAYYEITRHLETDPDGTPVLPAAGRRVPLPAPRL